MSEKQSLLYSDEGDNVPDDAMGFPCWRSLLAGEFRRLVELAGPLIVQYLAVNLQLTEDLAFVGQISALDLAAMNMANAVLFATLILPIGLSGATRVLTAQSFGSNDSRGVGIWLHVSTFWTFALFFIPISLLWWFGGNLACSFGLAAEEIEWLSEEPLDWVDPGQTHKRALLAGVLAPASHDDLEQQLCDKASEFARYSLLWLWPMVLFNLLATMLEGIEVVVPQMVISVAFIGVNFGIQHLFVSTLDWGLFGSPIATAVSKVLQLAVLLIWVALVQKQLNAFWVRPRWAHVLNWRRFMALVRIGGPMMLTEILYEWTFEAAIFMAAAVGVLEVATLGVVINLVFLLTPLLTGLYIATSVRTGVLLGNRDIHGAKRSIALVFKMAAGATLLGVLIMLLLRRIVATIYTSDEDVIFEVIDFMPLAALDFALSAGCYVLQGVLEGSGQPHKATLAAVVGAWCVGLPISLLLSLEMDMEITGVMIGMIVGEATKLILMTLFVLRTDWHQAVERVIQLTAEDDELERHLAAAASAGSAADNE